MPSVMTTAAASGSGFSALLSAIRDVYTAEVYFSAQPNMRFDQFATRKEDLTVQPGANIVLPKFGGMKRGGRLTEGVRLTTKAMSMSTSNISVDEQGNAVALSERLLQTSFYDNLAAGSMLLGRDMAIVLDLQLRDAARTTTTKVYGGGKASRGALVSGDGFGTATIHAACEQLETNNAPKWGNDFYICFVHPHQITSLRQSAGWVNAAQYAGAVPIFFGEVGRFNDVRFISTSMMPNGANSTVDSSTGEYADPGYDATLLSGAGSPANQATIYQALMFGEYSYGHAVALNVELRDNGVQDFGREHAIAWYAIWGSGLLETKNAVLIETA